MPVTTNPAVIPAVQGSYGKAWPINVEVFNPLTGAYSAEDLTPLGGDVTKIQVKLWNTITKTAAVSTGAIAIQSAVAGQITWQPTANDVATLGDFLLQVVVTWSTGNEAYKGPNFNVGLF